MNPAIVIAALLAVHPVIASHLECPSARNIESQLSVLLPDAVQPGMAVISATAEGLSIDLRPEDPTFAAMRTLTVGSDCEERARAVAVVISTWWPVLPQNAAPAPAHAAVGAPRQDLAQPSAAFGLAAGALASVTSDGASPGVRLEGSWRGRRFGLRVAGTYAGPQTSSLGPGRADWSRAAGEVGPTYSFGPARLDVGLVLSRLWIHGSGFEVNDDSTGFAVGTTLGGRATWDRWRVSPWIEMRGFLWPESRRAYFLDADTGIRTSHELPKAELQLAAGLALSFR